MDKKTFSDYGISIPYRRTAGNVKTYCPECRDKRTNKNDKSLSVNLDTGVWNCHYCGWSGHLEYTDEAKKEWMKDQPWYSEHKAAIAAQKPKNYRKPQPRPDNGISDKLSGWFNGRGISKETLLKMRITEGQEFIPQVSKQMNTVQFNYYRDGELINTKFRTGDKKFKFVQGAELLPYNIDGIKGTKECIITEGEIDALSFIECGRTDVVSAPAGSNANLSWMDDYMEGWFDDKETVYVASDTDRAGATLRDELVRRLGAYRCRIVTYGDDCKDANEHLVKYGKESLLQCLSSSKEIKVEGVFTVSDFKDRLDGLFDNGLQKGVTVGHPNLDNLLSLETKRLMVVTGTPGSGKSEFIDEMLVRLNLRYGWRTAFFSPENMPLEYHASKLIEKFAGQRFGVSNMDRRSYNRACERLESEFSFISPCDNYKLDGILERAEFLVRRKGIKVLVLDPYNRIDNEAGNMSETLYISQLLDKLMSFAQRNDTLVILVAHPVKMPKLADGSTAIPTLYDISGSANFFNKCDFGLCVHRDRENDIVRVLVQKVKFKHLGEPGEAIFKYNVQNGRYQPYDGAAVITWDDRDYLAPRNPEVRNVDMDFSGQATYEDDDSDSDYTNQYPY